MPCLNVSYRCGDFSIIHFIWIRISAWVEWPSLCSLLFHTVTHSTVKTLSRQG